VSEVRDQSFHEPLRVTLLRTGLLGLVVGIVVARVRGHPTAWPQWTAFALWFTFGGHWVEVFFLNWFRHRIPPARSAQIAGRLLTWLVGGTWLMLGAWITAMVLGTPHRELPPWWLGGPIFILLELLVHVPMLLRGGPSFYKS